MRIENSTALVTGANRGIGRALVGALLDAGARKVYAAARDISKLEPVRALGPSRIVALKLDVTDGADIASAARLARDVTILVNNAGVLDMGALLQASVETIERIFDTNVYGPLALARDFAPIIEANGGGAIVNILSVVALASMPALAAYNASKAAAWSMTQSLRADLSGKRISVHGVFPGPIDTDMAAGIELAKTSPEDAARAIVAGVNAGDEDIFPDPMAGQVYELWRRDHKAVEKQFAAA